MHNATHSTRYFIALSVAMIFWGIAWSIGKIAVNHADAHVCAFWRYAISFMSLLPLIYFLKISFKSDTKGVFYMVGAGVLTALFNYLFFEGVKHGQSGYGGTLVTALTPILTYILSIILFNSQQATKRVDAIIYSLVVFGITALVNMYFALPYHPFDLQSFDSTFWLSIIFIGLVPGTFSTVLFFISAGKVGAHNTAAFMFIVPIGAIISSWIIFDEKIELSTAIGCMLAFLAVVLFNIIKRKRKTL
ncbi:MAG: DMT family transporter [Sulfurovaceae bacterium]